MVQIQLHYFSITLWGWLLPCYLWVNIKPGLNELVEIYKNVFICWFIVGSLLHGFICTSYCFFSPSRKTSYILHSCYFVVCYVLGSVRLVRSSGQEWASLCVLFEVFWDLLRHKYLMIHATFLQREVKELNTKTWDGKLWWEKTKKSLST